MKKISAPKLGDITISKEIFIWLGMDNGVRTINCVHYIDWGRLFEKDDNRSAHIVTWYGHVKVML